MALIEAIDLGHSYALGGSAIWALKNVTLAIEPGEFVAIMGPSGSGKSTLLAVLGCLATPMTGVYRLNGTELSHYGRDARAAIRSRNIGFVFQNFSLLPRHTAFENVEIPLLYAGAAGPERRARVQQVLHRVGLADRAKHRPAQLSGGQQQRVAIARALVNGPSLLLADEPTGALDTRTSRDIMLLFDEINRQDRVTVVVVTHDTDVASYARRVITLRDGRIVSDDLNPEMA